MIRLDATHNILTGISWMVNNEVEGVSRTTFQRTKYANHYQMVSQ